MKPMKIRGGLWRGVSLRGTNLAGVDLCGLDLREADLYRTKLDLAGAVLLAELHGALVDSST